MFGTMLLSALLLAAIALLPRLDATLVNHHIKRTIHLRSAGVVREELSIGIEHVRGKDGTGSPVSEYLHVVPKEHAKKLAHVIAYSSDAKNILPIREVTSDVSQCAQEDGRCFVIELGQELSASNYRMIFGLVSTYIGITCAFPKVQASQSLPLKLRFDGNSYVYSAYPCVRQKTIILYPRGDGDNRIESLECQEPYVNSTERVCGIYFDIAPRSVFPLSTTYEAKGIQPLEIASLRRSYTPLPWVNELLVEENYKIDHTGFRVAGESFSRAEYALTIRERRAGETQVVPTIPLPIPAAAYAIKYWDEVGLVATRMVQTTPDGITVLEVAPRFPLIGGWSTTFSISYKLPLDLVARKPAMDACELHVPFWQTYYDLAAKEVTLVFNLPEAAKEVEAMSPLELEELPHRRYRTYFSSVGEQVYSYKKVNVVREHSLGFIIRFKYPVYGLFMKPAVALAAALAVVATAAFLRQLDCSLDSTRHLKKRLNAMLARRNVILQGYAALVEDGSKLSPEARNVKKARLDSEIRDVQGRIISTINALALSVRNVGEPALEQLYHGQLSSLDKVFGEGSDTSPTAFKTKCKEAIECDERVIAQEKRLLHVLA